MLTKEMKDSGVEWIGEIPNDWNLKKMKYILTERKIKNDPIITEEILSLSVERGVFPYSEKTGGGNKAKEDLTAYKVAFPGDIVVNSMNILAGAVGLSKYKGAVSPVYYTLYDESREIDINYYYYLFQTEAFQRSLLGLGNGIMMKESSTGKLNTIRMRIPMEKLFAIRLPIPPKDIQTKIVDYVSSKVESVEKIISETRRSIEEFRKYKLSIITETVTKGLDSNVKMKDSGIPFYGLIPKEWKLSNVGRMFEIILGKMLSPNQKEEDWTFEKYFSAANVHFSGVSESPYKKMWFSPYEKDIYKVKIGDLLIVEGGAGAGGSAIVESLLVDTYIQNSVFIIRTKGMISNKFLYYILYSLMNNGYMQYLGNVATFAHYTKEKVSKTPIVIPSILEQKKIVSYLDIQSKKIDMLIEDKEQFIEELEKYKKSLIYEYVTGKKEV